MTLNSWVITVMLNAERYVDLFAYKAHERNRSSTKKLQERTSRNFGIDNSPIPVVPMGDIDQIDTENNLNTISKPLFFRFGMVDGLPIDKQQH